MPKLLEQEVKIEDLLKSEVFSFSFDFDEWPTAHPYNKDDIRAYNFSIFEIRKHYRAVFCEPEYEPMSMDEESNSKQKIYKITYNLNLLPRIGTHF